MSGGTVRPKNRARYKPNTIRSYERAVRNYITPAQLGAVRVTDIRRADVQDLADQPLAEDLAAAMVSNILNPLQAFYRRAIDRDQLAHFGSIVPPPGPKPETESPATQVIETALRRGPFLGYYREERYVLLSVGGSRYQAPSGRLNRVDAVSVMCAKPNPTKKTVAMRSPAIPERTPAAMVAPASV
jgi:hypothetical protein